MNSQLRETNNKPLLNLEEREKKNLPSFLIDASVFVLILTGITYFLGFNYKKGFLSFYGIDKLMLDKIGIYYINISFKNMLVYIVVIGSIYMARPLLAVSSKTDGEEAYRKAQYDISMLLILGNLCGLIVLLITALNNHTLNNIISYIIGIIFGAICILVFIYVLLWRINKLLVLRHKNNLRAFFKDRYEALLLMVDSIKKSKLLKTIASLMIFLALSVGFWAMGRTDAVSKRTYLVINNKSQPLVVIDEDRDKLLVAPIDVKKGVIYQRYMIIESKSTRDKPMEFENYQFGRTLIVREPKEVTMEEYYPWSP